MHSSRKHDWGWMFLSVLFVAAVLLGVRYSSGILQTGFVFDEKYITVPIDNLIEHGWSVDRKSTRLNSSHKPISYAVFCLKKKKTTTKKE